jgi:hypothetical protein
MPSPELGKARNVILVHRSEPPPIQSRLIARAVANACWAWQLVDLLDTDGLTRQGHRRIRIDSNKPQWRGDFEGSGNHFD